MNDSKTTTATPPMASHTAPPAGSPRLFEISVLVNRTAVILALCEKDALETVETWEQAWEENSDLIGISDKQITEIRDLKVDLKDWDDEAHDASIEARKLIREANKKDEGRETNQ